MDTECRSVVFTTPQALCSSETFYISPFICFFSFGEHRAVPSLSFKICIFSKTKNPHNKENTLDKHCNKFVKQTMPLKAE